MCKICSLFSAFIFKSLCYGSMPYLVGAASYNTRGPILTLQMFEEYHSGRLFMHSVGGAVACSDNVLPVNHEISTLFV